MINYSIVMRSVNANLLEINQAKSRINQAKKDGKEPEKKDTDLVKTEKQNAFAISQYTDVMTIEKFAKHILLTAVCIQELTSAPSSIWQWTA